MRINHPAIDHTHKSAVIWSEGRDWWNQEDINKASRFRSIKSVKMYSPKTISPCRRRASSFCCERRQLCASRGFYFLFALHFHSRTINPVSTHKTNLWWISYRSRDRFLWQRIISSPSLLLCSVLSIKCVTLSPRWQALPVDAHVCGFVGEYLFRNAAKPFDIWDRRLVFFKIRIKMRTQAGWRLMKLIKRTFKLTKLCWQNAQSTRYTIIF
jgi:hypothetical protein